jgi:hypothetical protein
MEIADFKKIMNTGLVIISIKRGPSKALSNTLPCLVFRIYWIFNALHIPEQQTRDISKRNVTTRVHFTFISIVYYDENYCEDVYIFTFVLHRISEPYVKMKQNVSIS